MAEQWNQFSYEPVQNIILIGRAGESPAATANDIADFLFVVPFNITLLGLQATYKVAPTNNHTYQLRRSTNNGGSFSDAFGTVTVNSGERVGSSTPTALDIDAGDVLNFSKAAGNASGENVALFIRAQRR